MLAPGTIVDGRYAVGPVVGRGGMADVLRADDGRTGEPVALKLLRLHDDGSRARFRTETEVLRVLDHPAVVRLRDAGWHDEPGWHDPVPYLVLDLVEGPTLAGLLGRGALGVDRSLDVGGRLAEALAHAHGHGVVHRDVKPANVLFGGPDARHPRLADFGIARVADGTRLTAAGACVGTAAYLAPEQLEGAAGPAADVYALGLLLLECITGALCYPGTMAEAALARLHRAPVVPADLPMWLRHTVRAMTDRDPARRPGAVAVARALEERSISPLLSTTQPIPIAAGLLDLDSETGDRPGAVDALGHLTADRRRPPPTRPFDPTSSSPGAPPRPPRGVPGHAPLRPSLGGALAAALVVLVAVASALAYLGGDLRVTGADPSDPTDADSRPRSQVATAPATTAPPPTEAPPPALVAPTGDTGDGPGNGHGNGRANGHGRGQGGPRPEEPDDDPEPADD